jgi:hypothetical protein
MQQSPRRWFFRACAAQLWSGSGGLSAACGQDLILMMFGSWVFCGLHGALGRRSCPVFARRAVPDTAGDWFRILSNLGTAKRERSHFRGAMGLGMRA